MRNPCRIYHDGSMSPEREALLQAQSDEAWRQYEERNRRIYERYREQTRVQTTEDR